MKQESKIFISSESQDRVATIDTTIQSPVEILTGKSSESTSGLLRDFKIRLKPTCTTFTKARFKMLNLKKYNTSTAA